MIPIKYNVRSLIVRKTTTIATALGIGLVVCVLSCALMLSAGVKKTLGSSGHPDVALVLRKGSDAELGSVIDQAAINTILGNGAGIKKDDKGQPMGIAEVIVVGAMEKLGAVGVTNVQMRGVPLDTVRQFRPEVTIVEGRWPQAGTGEVVIGQRLRGRFKGLEMNGSFDLRKNRPAKVVGVFSAAGSSYESEVWADLDTLRSAYGRDGVSSVRVKLESTAAFDGFRANMESDKQFGFTAMRETEYYEKQSEGTALFLTIVGAMVSLWSSIGAMIGAMITMYAAVANRKREIGTLRALGFSRRSILLSFLLESVLLSLAGGLLGALAAMGMGFVKFSMMNLASWSEIVFTFDPTPGILGTALIFAAGMGLIGGFFPAVRAARTSPIQAMRGG